MVNFKGKWFGVVEGVPTGGIPSVSIANISVYFVFKSLIYSQGNESLIGLLRFVDDGLGLYTGDVDTFRLWFDDVRKNSLKKLQNI